jgi:acyl dehydratase
MTTRLCLEDFSVGQTFVLGPHAVTAEAIVAFAQEFDPQPFHLDRAAGEQSVLEGLAASGWHTTSLLVRMMCDACLTRTDLLGSSGMDEIKWLKPVHAGDVLSGSMEITGVRASKSRPGIGIVQFVCALGDQRGVAKAEMRGMVWVRMREP